MACCKVCCGCAICEEGDQGKCCCGTGSSAVCCEEGEYCCDGACQAEPCCTETECRQYTYDSTKDDEAGDFSTFAIGTCEHSDTTIESLGEIDGVETWRYTTLVTITCECLASFEAATGPLRGPDAENPGDPISYEVVPCGIWCCEVDEDNNPTGNCFLSEAEGQDCAQGVTYDSEAACLDGCEAPP